MPLIESRTVDLPKMSHPLGDLTFCEGQGQVLFDIKRAYYAYHVLGGSDRAAYAHKAH